MNKYITAVDIGSHKIKAVIAEVGDDNDFVIIGKGETLSREINKGDIMDLNKTSEDIESAIEQAEIQSGHSVEKIFLGLSGAHIQSKNDKQHIPISKKSQQIDDYDIKRVLSLIESLNTQVGREVLHIIPQTYIVDGVNTTKDIPIGAQARRLEVKAHVITGLVISAHNIVKAVNKAGFGVYNVVLSPYSATFASLTNDNKEMGCIYVDIGGDLTNIIVFIDGNVWYSKTIAIGSQSITNDIAYTLRINLKNAEKLKIKYGTVDTENIQDEVLKVAELGEETKTKSVNKSFLSEIISFRLREILEDIGKIIQSANIELLIPGGIIFGGGGSNVPGILNMAKDIYTTENEDGMMYEINVRLGKPQNFKFNRNESLGLEWAAPIGIVKYVLNEKNNFKHYDFDNESNLFKNIISSLKNLIKNYTV